MSRSLLPSIPGSDRLSGSSQQAGWDCLEQSIKTIASTEPLLDYVSFIKCAQVADVEVVPYSALQISQTRLGIGAYMTVFRGSCPEKFGDTPLAIKLMDIPLPRGGGCPSAGTSCEGYSEFRRFEDDWAQQLRLVSLELRVLSDRLLRCHPNIVNLLGISFIEETFVADDGRGTEFFKPVLILEEAHPDHPTLERFYANAKSRGDGIPMDLKVSLWCNVADALSAVHAVGVVHGDIKPANVLLFQDHRHGKLVAKLSDFGGCQPAHIPEDTYQDHELLGTEYWNAPEVYDRSHPHYRFPSRDYFSFGLLGIYILFESYPFAAPQTIDAWTPRCDTPDDATRVPMRFFAIHPLQLDTTQPFLQQNTPNSR